MPTNNPASPAFYCHGDQLLSPAQMVERPYPARRGDPNREASFHPLPAHLSPPTASALKAIGVARLYSHEVEAITAAVSGGKHTVIFTSTSSDRSLCYNMPVLESISCPA
jgi:DEAD/DEAH box helicase domain-containing protein